MRLYFKGKKSIYLFIIELYYICCENSNFVKNQDQMQRLGVEFW